MSAAKLDQLIIAPTGQLRRVVRNIEHTGGSIYGEVTIDGVAWIARRERGNVWRAIGRKADLDRAEQGSGTWRVCDVKP